MANEPARYGLTDSDRKALRRVVKNFDAASPGTAPRHKRRRAPGGGGRSFRARGVATDGIAAFSSGTVVIEVGTPLSSTWWNLSPRAIPPGYTCYSDEYGGQQEIHSAFCPELEEEE